MRQIEAIAKGRSNESIAARIRGTLNYFSDALQIAKARTIYQNTWQWYSSWYTISEMTQTWLWSKTGFKTIIRFYEPWQPPGPIESPHYYPGVIYVAGPFNMLNEDE
jgi:hypothetical protein